MAILQQKAIDDFTNVIDQLITGNMSEAQQEANEILTKFNGNKYEACCYVTEIINVATDHKPFWQEVKVRMDCAQVDEPKPKRTKIVKKKLSLYEARILSAMKSFDYFTDKKISVFLGVKASEISPRRKEFYKMGLIKQVSTEKNVRGRNVIIWSVVK